jgi:hypothetical protein
VYLLIDWAFDLFGPFIIPAVVFLVGLVGYLLLLVVGGR